MTKKIAIVLDEKLSSGIALNTTAHIMASVGSYVKNLIGKEIIDASGNKHLGIPIYPNVILRASSNEIKKLVKRARERGLFFVDYPKQGFTTNTDEEYVKEVSKETTESIIYIGVAFFGNKEEVNEITGKLSLWK